MIVAFQSDSFNTDIMSACHPHRTRVIWRKSIWKHWTKLPFKRTEFLGFLDSVAFHYASRHTSLGPSHLFSSQSDHGCSSIWGLVGTGEIYLSPASKKIIRFRHNKFKFQCQLGYAYQCSIMSFKVLKLFITLIFLECLHVMLCRFWWMISQPWYIYCCIYDNFLEREIFFPNRTLKVMMAFDMFPHLHFFGISCMVLCSFGAEDLLRYFWYLAFGGMYSVFWFFQLKRDISQTNTITQADTIRRANTITWANAICNTGDFL